MYTHRTIWTPEYTVKHHFSRLVDVEAGNIVYIYFTWFERKVSSWNVCFTLSMRKEVGRIQKLDEFSNSTVRVVVMHTASIYTYICIITIIHWRTLYVDRFSTTQDSTASRPTGIVTFDIASVKVGPSETCEITCIVIIIRSFTSCQIVTNRT